MESSFNHLCSTPASELEPIKSPDPQSHATDNEKDPILVNDGILKMFKDQESLINQLTKTLEENQSLKTYLEAIERDYKELESFTRHERDFGSEDEQSDGHMTKLIEENRDLQKEIIETRSKYKTLVSECQDSSLETEKTIKENYALQKKIYELEVLNERLQKEGSSQNVNMESNLENNFEEERSLLTAENNKLQKQVNEIKEKHEELLSEHQISSVEIDKAHAEISMLQNTIKELGVNNVKNDRGELEERITNLTEENNKIKENLEETLEKYNQVLSECRESSSQMEKTLNDNSDLQKRIHELELTNERLQLVQCENMNSNDVKVTVLTEENSKLLNVVEELRMKHEQLLIEYHESFEETEKALKENSRIQERIEELEAANERLNIDKEIAQEEYENSEKSRVWASERIQELEQLVEDIDNLEMWKIKCEEATNASVQKELEIMNHWMPEKSRLESLLEAKTATCNYQKSLLKQNEEQIKQLRREKEEISSDYKPKVKVKTKEVNVHAGNSSGIHTELRNELIEADNQKLKNENQKILQQHESLKERIKMMERELSQKRLGIEQLNQELKGSKEKYKELHANFTKLSDQIVEVEYGKTPLKVKNGNLQEVRREAWRMKEKTDPPDVDVNNCTSQ